MFGLRLGVFSSRTGFNKYGSFSPRESIKCRRKIWLLRMCYHVAGGTSSEAVGVARAALARDSCSPHEGAARRRATTHSELERMTAQTSTSAENEQDCMKMTPPVMRLHRY